MKVTVALALFAVALYTVEGAASGKVCRSSYACGKSSCCRDSLDHVIADADGLVFGPGPSAGTCSTKLAQKGEVCDGSCTCAPGLLCYRPMSGVCCPPQTCMDQAYVIKQKQYWANCMASPNCAIPP